MCLMLYLATPDDQPLQNGPDLSIEALDGARSNVSPPSTTRATRHP